MSFSLIMLNSGDFFSFFFSSLCGSRNAGLKQVGLDMLSPGCLLSLSCCYQKA